MRTLLTERETELKRQQIELREKELDALVRKQADADKYAAEKNAEAELIARQKKAEAERYEIEQAAEAMKKKADAAKYAALAEAEGIAAKGKAEAEAIEKKAEAQKKMSDASIIDMALSALPEMIANAAAPLNNIDKITLYGNGNSTKLIGDVMNSTNQIIEGVKEATGLDISAMIASYLNNKNINS